MHRLVIHLGLPRARPIEARARKSGWLHSTAVGVPRQSGVIRPEYVFGRQGMAKKLTITVDDEVYEDLHGVIGARRINRF